MANVDCRQEICADTRKKDTHCYTMADFEYLLDIDTTVIEVFQWNGLEQGMCMINSILMAHPTEKSKL
jgi:hypothetical protein